MALAAIVTGMTNKPLSIKDSQLFLGDVEGEQLDVLQYPIESDLLVSGPAGSGKTILALKRHKRFVEEKKIGEILVYTNILKDFINQKTGINSKSIFKYIKDETRIPFDDFLSKEVRFAKFSEDAANWSKENQNQLYYLIVDEAQDLYLSLLEFCSNYAGILNLLADDAQQLYKHGNCTTVMLGKLSKDNNRIVKRLDIKGNYRNHETVAKITNPFYNKRKEEPFKWNVKDTRPVLKASIFVSNNDNNLNNALLEKTRDYVIDPSSQSIPKTAIITQNNVISVKEVFNQSYPTFTTQNGLFNGTNIFESSDPVILTMHSVKGLEFEYVLIANLDYKRLKEEFPENYNQMLFTAITRARYSLSIFIKKDQEEFLNRFENVDNKYYEIIEV